MDMIALDRQLGDLAWCLSTGLRAGYSLRQVLEGLASEAPEPTSSACKRLLASFDQGLPLEVALADWKEVLPSAQLARLAGTVLSHRQTGGNLADLLDPLGEDFLRQSGSDPSFHASMRQMAKALGAPLPERAKSDS